MPKRRILYYISSHGLGHAARAAQVIRELLKTYDVQIKTLAPPWLLEQIIGEKTPIIPIACDVGCIQRNNQDVDVQATIEAYRKQSHANRQMLAEEIGFIRENKIDLIVSDIASFPFLVASKASIPSLFIGNFTWKGIYRNFLDSESDPILAELGEAYGLATKSLLTPFSMDMPELGNQTSINLIARVGKNVRKELLRRYGIPEGNRLVFHYAGNLGTNNKEPERIRELEGFTVISFTSPSTRIENFVTLEKGSFRHEDITASSDVVLVKPGYGMLSEALANKVPVIFPPRTDFAEYFAFLKEYESIGGYVPIGREDFDSGNWSESLAQAVGLRYRREYAANGAEQCKAAVDALLQ